MIPLPIIDAVLGIGSKVIDRVWPDPAERDKAKLELLRLTQEGEFKDLEASMQVVVAEARSEHWLTAAWRPMTMLSFVAIILHNMLLAPYLQWIFGMHLLVDIPPDLWDLIKLGIGGYVVSRGAEKVVKEWKGAAP